jgi:hypothetical protein
LKESGKAFPEFYHLFEDDTGPITVSIACRGNQGLAAQRRMYPEEIDKLLCPDDGGFLRHITLDEWPLEILKIELRPDQSSVNISAKLVKE